MTLDDDRIRQLAKAAPNRLELWSEFVREAGARSVAEVGVYRGAFAERILDGCPEVERYYMVDPWRHLDDILRNGALFAEQWGEWPMVGWIDQFIAAGAVEAHDGGYRRTNR